jgi:hypothetical protein
VKIPDSPEGWQKERKAAPEVETVEKTQSRLIGYVLLTVVLVAAVLGYLYLARDSSLAGDVPIPKALAIKSAGHDDLMLVGRELGDVARDAQQRLGFKDAASAAAGQRLLRRIETLRVAGRKLEPKLTRDEQRSLMAFEQAERLLVDYVNAADDGTGDDSLVTQARQQLANGLSAGRGEHIDDLIIPRKTKVPAGLQDLNDVRRAKLRLVGE